MAKMKLAKMIVERKDARISLSESWCSDMYEGEVDDVVGSSTG